MKSRLTIFALAIALVTCALSVRAQDQKQDSQSGGSAVPLQPINSGLGGGYSKRPAPAARGVAADYNDGVYDPSQVTPDQNTLAGAQEFGIGSLTHAHNLFDPMISVSQLGQVSPALPGQTSLTSDSLIGGTLNFSRNWSQYHFTTIYNGGETIYKGQLNYTGSFHDLIVSSQIDLARWHFILRDDFLASPGAAFTNSGMGGPGLSAQFASMLGASLTSIGQSFMPAETINTGYAMRYRNAVLGQAEYSFSRRSAFTASASYGFLHFPDAGYFSSRMMNVQAGYDYLLSPTNSIAILGGYGKINYTGTTISTTDYMAALAYGKKITGRMAFQAAVGPQQIRSINTAGPFELWYLTVNSKLSYERRRSGVALSFASGLNSGSGVFYGETDKTISGTGHYELTRYWTATVNGGYAFSNSLAPAGTPTTAFNNWFVGGNLGRRLGPHIVANFNYGMQRQGSPTACPVTSCGGTGLQQTLGITVNWHLHPAG